jgi:hypothetical protein
MECVGEGEIDTLPERETVLLSRETSMSRGTAHITHVSLNARSDGALGRWAVAPGMKESKVLIEESSDKLPRDSLALDKRHQIPRARIMKILLPQISLICSFDRKSSSLRGKIRKISGRPQSGLFWL